MIKATVLTLLTAIAICSHVPIAIDRDGRGEINHKGRITHLRIYFKMRHQEFVTYIERLMQDGHYDLALKMMAQWNSQANNN